MKGLPSHNLEDFENDCCENKEKVIVWPVAANTARKDFRLKNAAGVVLFIGEKGLESPSLINTKPWKKNPNPNVLIMADAYRFYSGSTFGYLSFFYDPETKQWQIKSFQKKY